MGSLGTITVGQGWGGNSTGFDEEVPQAYEQISEVQAALLLLDSLLQERIPLGR
jgi:hypothetical protein